MKRLMLTKKFAYDENGCAPKYRLTSTPYAVLEAFIKRKVVVKTNSSPNLVALVDAMTPVQQSLCISIKSQVLTHLRVKQAYMIFGCKMET